MESICLQLLLFVSKCHICTFPHLHILLYVITEKSDRELWLSMTRQPACSSVCYFAAYLSDSIPTAVRHLHFFHALSRSSRFREVQAYVDHVFVKCITSKNRISTHMDKLAMFGKKGNYDPKYICFF